MLSFQKNNINFILNTSKMSIGDKEYLFSIEVDGIRKQLIIDEEGYEELKIAFLYQDCYQILNTIADWGFTANQMIALVNKKLSKPLQAVEVADGGSVSNPSGEFAPYKESFGPDPQVFITKLQLDLEFRNLTMKASEDTAVTEAKQVRKERQSSVVILAFGAGHDFSVYPDLSRSTIDCMMDSPKFAPTGMIDTLFQEVPSHKAACFAHSFYNASRWGDSGNALSLSTAVNVPKAETSVAANMALVAVAGYMVYKAYTIAKAMFQSCARDRSATELSR